MAARDPKGFYKALNVGVGASQTEIRLAYKFLKGAYRDGKKLTNIGLIQSAYQTLSDPKLRAQYDRHSNRTPRSGRPTATSRLDSIPMLVGAGVLCIATMAVAFGPNWMSHWVSFDVGDEIVWRQTEKPLGTILEFKSSYEFPENATQAAYKVRMNSGDAQWFPANDLHRGAKTR